MKDINSLKSLLNKVSFIQLVTVTALCFIYLFFSPNSSILSGFIISGIISVLYSQLLKVSSTNTLLLFFGFPIRLIILIPPAAILVHKFHSNLIALFIGFVLCQLIYILLVLQHTKKIKVEG